MADEKKPEMGVLGIAAAVGATVAAVSSGEKLAAASVGSALWDVVQRTGEFLRDRQQRLVCKLLEEAYFATSSDPGAFSDFSAMFTTGDLKSESGKNVFLQTVRAAEAAVDEAVLPSLSMLMRHYVRAGQRYDSFFRSWSRLLQELSADEHESLRRIVKGISESLGDKRRVYEHEKTLSIRGDYLRSAAQRKSGDEGGIIVGHGIDVTAKNLPREHAVHLFHLLTVNGLATEVPTPLAAPKTDRDGRLRPPEYEPAPLAVDMLKAIAAKLVEVTPSK